MAAEPGAIDAGEGRRPWEDLGSDLLVSIFSMVGLADLVAGIPFVCSSWRMAARDPACWRNPDFRDWEGIARRLGCRRDADSDFADLLDFAISRSDEFLNVVHFPAFADEIDLVYVSERCPELVYFSIENPSISEDKFCRVIERYEFLTGMAVHESLICEEVLKHVNQCCQYFFDLKVFAETVGGEMASVICKWLPHLRRLDISDCTISQLSMLTFLDELKELEYLDISGYENSGITGKVLEKASRLKVFRWDSRFQEGEFEYCSDCEEDYFFQAPCECVMGRKFMDWLADLD